MKLISTCVWMVMLFSGTLSWALSAEESAQIASGKSRAAACVACHGDKGHSVNPLWPNLAGQKKEYLKKQITDFKEGRRKDPLMTPMASTISTEDAEVLAAYFSSL